VGKKKQTPEEYLVDSVKREIADRYFGARKLIEEDAQAFEAKLKEDIFFLEKWVSFDLVRIYILLRDEELIRRFLQLTGLGEHLFYDPYLTESPTIRARVFKGHTSKGLTRYRRFRNTVLDCYERLERHLRLYREKLVELEADLETINSEIKQFQEKNDMSTILGFFRSLGATTRLGDIEGGLESGIAEELDQKLRLEPLPPLDHYLPVVPPLKPLSSVRKGLEALTKSAYKSQTEEERGFFTAG
jgi:hypothetical protein